MYEDPAWEEFLSTGIDPTGGEIEEDGWETYEKQPVHIHNYNEIVLSGGNPRVLKMALEKISGVYKTTMGFVNGFINNPTYSVVRTQQTGYAECVRVFYDPLEISLHDLLIRYFGIINFRDSTLQNGGIGNRRNSISCVCDEEYDVAKKVFREMQKIHKCVISVEVTTIFSYWDAE